ncbi:MAG: HlyD family efflux transporter periplasmic adaptor subunit [Verrucomicrobiota bacterium]
MSANPSIDLDSLLVTRAGPSRYLLTQKNTGKCFELKHQEFYLLQLFDGTRSFEKIQVLYKKRFNASIAVRQIRNFFQKLGEEQFHEPSGSYDNASEIDQGVLRLHSTKEHKEILNQLFCGLNNVIGWTLHPLMFLTILLMLPQAIMIAYHDWDLFFKEYYVFLHGDFPTPIVILIAVACILILVNIPRELIVGIACRKFGGQVEAFRFFWYKGLLPRFLCSIGDSFPLVSAKGQAYIIGAPNWYHLGLCIVSILCWKHTDNHTALHSVWLLITFISCLTLFLHSNIFLKGGGYRVLCYLCKNWRIHEMAKEEVQNCLHEKGKFFSIGSLKSFWLRYYGIGCYFNMVLLNIAVVVVGWFWLTDTMGGLGAVLLMTAIGYWHRSLLKESFMSISDKGKEKFPQIDSAFRWFNDPMNKKKSRIIIMILIFMILLFPYPRTVGGKCRLLPVKEQGIRSQIVDEIITIHVQGGEWVQKGQLLVTLSGRDLREELSNARVSYDVHRSEEEYWSKDYDILQRLQNQNAATQRQLELSKKERDIAKSRAEGLKSTIEYLEGQLEFTEIKAPIEGRVVTPYLERRIGQVAQKGELLVTIQDTSNLLIEVAADQDAAKTSEIGMNVSARLHGLDGALVKGEVVSVSNIVTSGSSLNIDPVRTDRETSFQSSIDSAAEEDFSYRIYAELHETDYELKPGMTGYSKISVGWDFLFYAYLRPVIRFVRTEVWSWIP